ncbi:MAG TPA: carboxypeptidase-like regulatory domain-containing protein, partial [Thermoanaerobaculia bacterium]|nr:carboxypeptidase-like regulatory domain-containing protein [Thermoanaerobaculia bacterium]
RPDGSFEIAAPEPGLYEVTVRVEGFLPLRAELRPLIEDTELPPAELVPASAVEVRIVGTDGNPVPGAPVHTFPVPETSLSMSRVSRWRPADRLDITGADGKIQVLSSPGGTLHTTTFSRFGFARSEVRERSATLRLAAAKRVDLEVRDARGKKVAGALVRLPTAPVGLTGPEGRLTLSLPDEETYLLVETEDGQFAVTSLAPAGATGPRTVTLTAPVTAEGRVVDAESKAPVPGALVWSEGMLRPRPVRAAADGSFRLQVPGMPSPLQAAAPGYLTERTLPPPPSEEGGASVSVALRLTRAGFLSGRVVDADGRPVAGARVRARSQSMESVLQPGDLQAWSGADGGFRLQRLRTGRTYELAVDKEGFAPGSGLGEAAAPGSAAKPVRLVLSRGGTAFGKVVDESGRPVAGAAVEIRPVYDPFQGNIEDLERAVSAASKADGSFELRPLAPGSFTLQARSPGFAPAYVQGIEVPATEGRIDLGTVTLSPEAVIEGQVTDPRGAPVAGAKVYADSQPPPEIGPDGRFRIGGLSPGTRVQVSAVAKGYATTRLEGLEVPLTAPLRIELQPLGKLSGRVLDPAGEPVAGAFVMVNDEEWPGTRGSGDAIGATDDQGRFQIDLEPGPVELSVQAEGYRRGSWRGEVPEKGDARPAEIRLERGATLEGRVLDAEGNPVGGADVSVSSGMGFFEMMDLGGDRPDARSDGNGRYRLRGLETGVFQVLASASEGEATTSVSFEVQPGVNQLDLTLETGVEVAGHVRDDAGLPVAGAAVQLFSITAMNGQFLDAISATDGAFHFPHVPDGTYQLMARKRGLAPAHQDLEVAGQPLSALDVRLAAGGTITGRLLGLSPGDLAGVRVTAYGESEGGEGAVRQDGTYRIRELPPGEWTVDATLASGRSVKGTVLLEPGMTEAVLDLDLSGNLSLSGVLRIDGLPVPGAMLSLSPVDGSEGAGGESTTGPDGSFRMTRLEPGAYSLSAQSMEARIGLERPIELGADQEVVLEIATSTVQGQLLSPAGAPAANALISLTGTHGEWSVHAFFHSDGQGRFETRLPSGEYELTIFSEPGEARLRVPAGGVSNVQVRVQP